MAGTVHLALLDLRQQIHSLVIMHGDTLQFVWVPSHVNFEGNEQADKLAEKGRLIHPHNDSQQAKRRRIAERKDLWHALGLVEMFLKTESQQTNLNSERTSDPETPQTGTPRLLSNENAMHVDDVFFGRRTAREGPQRAPTVLVNVHQ